MRRSVSPLLPSLLVALLPSPQARAEAPVETLSSLLDEFGGVAMERQLQLADLVGKREWTFSMETGTLAFDDQHRYAVQILGTEAGEKPNWLWSWANKESNLPPRLVRAAERVRQEGERRGVFELKEGTFSGARVDGHALAMVAEGLAGGAAYYRAPYEGGVVYLLITDPKFPPLPEPSTARMADAFEALVGRTNVDPRRSFEAYARARGFTVIERAGDLVATHPKAGILVVRRDEKGRVTKLLTDEPPAKPPARARKKDHGPPRSP